MPSQALPAEANGAVWVDYIADLGDGFEATYAMAYLLAADELKVAGESAPLPAGQLLIMGGDQVYPDATKQEYSNRLRDPYDWAFSTTDPKRKLFAIPGNHDWYDGLSAFSALFCSARDRISKGLGTQIGGWRCHQHRSYFAIKLPHNWWIWGPDIQLADNLDDSQRDYFDLMAEQTKQGDNIILCLAEPSWLHKNYDNMHEISMLARKNGAKICAVIAGDWHHYSRYTSDKLGIQFITAGGGGAFAHATHGLKNSIGAELGDADGRDQERSRARRIPTRSTAWKNPSWGRPGATSRRRRRVQHPRRPQPPASVAPEPKPITDTDAGPGGIGRRAKAVRKEDIKSASLRLRGREHLSAEIDQPASLPEEPRPAVPQPAVHVSRRPHLFHLCLGLYRCATRVSRRSRRNMVESINLELSGKVTEMQRIDTRILQLEAALKGPVAPTDPTSAIQQAQRDRDARELRQLQSTKVEKQSEIDAIGEAAGCCARRGCDQVRE